MILTCTPAATTLTLAAQEITVALHFQAPHTSERVPVDVVVVADTSGSMEGPKLLLLQETIRVLAREVVAPDRVGVVSFSDLASDVFPLTVMDASGKTALDYAVNALRAYGNTNLSGGLFGGIQQLTKVSGEGRVRAVLLLTDGQSNAGLCQLEVIRPVLEGMLRATEITVHAFGFGPDHDSTMLRGIVNGRGSLYYVETVENLRSSFGDCLGGLLSVVAQNLTVTLTALEGATITCVHHKNATKIGAQSQIPFADLYAEEQRYLLVNLRLPESPVGEMPVLEAALDYVDVRGACMATLTSQARVNRRAIVLDPGFNLEVELQLTRLGVADSLDAARVAGEGCNFEEARRLLDGQQAKLAELRARTVTAEGRALLNDFEIDVARGIEGLKTVTTFQTARHAMASAAEGYTQQRCMAPPPPGMCRQTSQTKAKQEMAEKFSS